MWLGIAACERPHPDPPKPNAAAQAPRAAAGDSAQSVSGSQNPPRGGAGSELRVERTTAEARAEPPALAAGGALAARSEHGMVVCVESQATRAGTSVLAAGGNAIDAAVATAYALAVTHPSAGNLGGGGFMLIAPAAEPLAALDFRERAPAALDAGRFDAMLASGARGPGAVAVPGSVAGLNAAHARYGRLPRAQVLAPAIRLAREGHRVGPREALTLSWNWQHLRQDPEARRIFAPRGRLLQRGARLVRSDLAATLERIARDGDDGFYTGPTARAFVATMGSRGVITEADLRDYRAIWRMPLEFDYRGFRVATMPPPSSGGIAIRQMLAALELLGKGDALPSSAEDLHLFLEISKRAQALRRLELVDPDAAPADMANERLLQRFSATTLIQDFPPIDSNRATPSAEVHPAYAELEREPEHTTQISVVDEEGNAVSLTTTLSSGFGAGYVVRGTGVVPNNSLAAFGKVGQNLPAGGRRMLSSMSPTIVQRHGRVAAVLGSPGGDTIPSTVVLVLRLLIERGWSIDAAVEAPRIHHGFVPDVVRYEKSRPPPDDVLASLRRLGHTLEAKGAPIGDAKNIAVVAGVAYGHADTREGGLALGPEPM